MTIIFRRVLSSAAIAIVLGAAAATSTPLVAAAGHSAQTPGPATVTEPVFPYAAFGDVPRLGNEPVRGTGCGADGSIGEVVPDGIWAGFVDVPAPGEPLVDRPAVHLHARSGVRRARRRQRDDADSRRRDRTGPRLPRRQQQRT